MRSVKLDDYARKFDTLAPTSFLEAQPLVLFEACSAGVASMTIRDFSQDLHFSQEYQELFLDSGGIMTALI